MIYRMKDKEIGHTDIIFSWMPTTISVHMSDDEGYNLPSRRYVCWLSYIKRTVVSRMTWGLYREYGYAYTMLGAEDKA